MALPLYWASPRRTIIIMKKIHQNRPKEGIFLKNSRDHAPRPPMLYVPDRANGDFSVIHDSERCVL